jgi:hypothetical protein
VSLASGLEYKIYKCTTPTSAERGCNVMGPALLLTESSMKKEKGKIKRVAIYTPTDVDVCGIIIKGRPTTKL